MGGSFARMCIPDCPTIAPWWFYASPFIGAIIGIVIAIVINKIRGVR